MAVYWLYMFGLPFNKYTAFGSLTICASEQLKTTRLYIHKIYIFIYFLGGRVLSEPLNFPCHCIATERLVTGHVVPEVTILMGPAPGVSSACDGYDIFVRLGCALLSCSWGVPVLPVTAKMAPLDPSELTDPAKMVITSRTTNNQKNIWIDLFIH